MAKSKERRGFPRVPLSCHLRYLRIPKNAAAHSNATVLDVCPGGLSFRANEEFQRRSCFLLDLYPPDSHPIRSLATVVWVRALPEGAGYQIGGRFVEPSFDVGAAIAHLVPEQENTDRPGGCRRAKARSAQARAPKTRGL